MTTQLRSGVSRVIFAWLMGALCSLFMSGVAWASPGAIWTSLGNGQPVNANLYDAKPDVYLNGGPNNSSGGAGIPDGTYYFQVTDPSGAVLLSLDSISCRQVIVSGGRINGASPAAGLCAHSSGSDPSFHNQPVQLIPFADTPNTGGEYKVWLTPVSEYNAAPNAAKFGFSGDTKTDNFKVVKPNPAYVVACKFNDLDADGSQGVGEPIIPGWTMTATGVDGGTVTKVTDVNGCASFAVTSFPAGTITLTEGTSDNWIQIGPTHGSGRNGISPAFTVDGQGVVTTTDVQPGDLLQIEFGNFNTSCEVAGHCEPPPCITRGECDTFPGLTITADAFPSFKIDWTLLKTADETTINTNGTATAHYTVTVGHTISGISLTGTLTVTNPTTADAIGVNVVNPTAGPGACSVVGGSNVTIPASSSVPFTFNCSFASLADALAATQLTASVNWFGGADSASATPVVVNFNAATIADGAVTVTDPMPAPGGTSIAVNWNDPNPQVLHYSVPLTGTPGTCVDFPNTATLTSSTVNSLIGPAPGGTPLVSSASVKVCTGANPTVEKTAATTFKRTYNWKVEKSVDTNRQVVNGGTAPFNYTVKVTQLAPTDSDWKVTGVITVTNPNNFEAMSVNVVDSLPSATCTVDTPTLTVPISGSASTNYSCTYSSAPPATPVNTANVSWNKDTYSTPAAAASGTASVTFGLPTTTVNKVVTVKDVFGTDAPVTLDSAITATDPPAAPTVATFTYKKDLGGSAGTCTSYSNTATYTSNDSSATGNASQTVQVCQGQDLSVSKTATPSFKRAYTWSLTKDVNSTRINTNGGNATFNYTVVAAQTGQNDSEWKVAGMITVTNPNDFEDVTVNLADAIGALNCVVNSGTTSVLVPKKTSSGNGSVQVPYLCTYSTAPGASTFTNTATATWNATTFGTPTGSATGTAGGNFNTPTSTLYKTVTITDNFNSGGATPLGTLTATDTPPPATGTYTYSHSVGSAAGTCTTYPNVATLASSDAGFTNLTANKSVEVCVGANLSVSKTVGSTFGRTYNWTLAKNVDKTRVDIGAGGSATFNYTVTATETGYTDSNFSVTGNITVTNPNTWQAVTVNLSDALDNGGSCVVNGGTTSVSVPAKVGSTNGSVTVPYSCTYGSQPSATTFTNTATATWDASAAFTPVGTASGQAGGNFNTPSSTKNASINVTDNWNGTGVVSLGSVTASDSPPKSQSFTYSKTVNGVSATCTTYNNTAVLAGGAAGDTATGSASQSVMVCVGASLQVSKTAQPSYQRIYTWGIQKTVDRTLYIAGGTANYTITVTQTGVADGNWTVMGNISVTNPNDWESVTFNVADSINNGGVCSITGGGNALVVAAGATRTVPYVCTYSSAPSQSGFINTALATVTSGVTASNTSSGTASGAFTTPSSVVNKTVSVNDLMNSTLTALGSATGTDAAPYTVATFPFSATIAPPANGGCAVTNNTASIVETGQTASAQVSSCAIAGHTMGFWHNNNGQRIIDGANQSDLGNWLRQFDAFADAPNSGVAGSVGDWGLAVIDAASCGGATCNKMLRAQMLATAFAVYFTDPALGGNKLNQPVPIGGALISLTNPENVKAAFGGAPSMTIMNMLLFQNGVSDNNGVTWYSQNKTLQVLAKDAFDNINNGKIFGP